MLPKLSKRGDFARSIERDLEVFLAERSGDRFADRGQWLMGGAAFAGFGGAMAVVLIAAGPWAVAAIPVAALSAFMMVVVLGHDATHGTATRSKRGNRWLVFWIFGLLGISGALWRDRHLRLHHAFPNLPGTGIDADSTELLRLSPDTPWRPWHRFQPLLAPIFFAIGMLHLVWIEDFQMFAEARRRRSNAVAGPGGIIAFAATKILHAALLLGAPVLIGGISPSATLIGYVAGTMIISIAFSLLVIGTHISEHAAFPTPMAGGTYAEDWAALQVVTSVDWSPTSGLAARLTGGANAHTAHHLFPTVSHCHAPALSKLVAQRCAEHGLPYRPVSRTDALRGFARHVVKLGRPPTPGDGKASYTCSNTNSAARRPVM